MSASVKSPSTIPKLISNRAEARRDERYTHSGRARDPAHQSHHCNTREGVEVALPTSPPNQLVGQNLGLFLDRRMFIAAVRIRTSQVQPRASSACLLPALRRGGAWWIEFTLVLITCASAPARRPRTQSQRERGRECFICHPLSVKRAFVAFAPRRKRESENPSLRPIRGNREACLPA